ncbi:hypothetical protein [Campylobacter hyointestinalis]|nr:hypothetical protein [Campylobacter hyointestinalis]
MKVILNFLIYTLLNETECKNLKFAHHLCHSIFKELSFIFDFNKAFFSHVITPTKCLSLSGF